VTEHGATINQTYTLRGMMKRTPINPKRTTPRRNGEPAPRIKDPANFRSQKLRDLAQECPRCMFCDRPNDGTVVGCHPNGLKYGKGMGVKAHDLLAYGCRECHDLVDGRTGSLTAHERETRWLDAFYWSTLWLVQTGHLGVMA